MSVSIAIYFAARKRLELIRIGVDRSDVYPTTDATIGGDKLTVYDAEHDREPATAEWLREVGFKDYHGSGTSWSLRYLTLEVVFTTVGSGLTLCGEPLVVGPTRGDIFTSLRLFHRLDYSIASLRSDNECFSY